jgi:uncharacterized repeat protein (TIGR02543 family)
MALCRSVHFEGSMKIGKLVICVVSSLSCAAGLAGCGGGSGASLSGVSTGATTYSVTYDGNGATGGAVPVDSNKYASGATVTVLGNSGSLVNAGYTFSGWNTLANGAGTAYAAGATFAMGSNNVVLYAQWTQVPTYTVAYNANGATGGAVPVDSNKYASGATVTVLGNSGSLVNAGYTFSGWNTLANGSGTAYAAGATFAMGSNNLTLYAQWTPVPTYTVAYNGNGATGGAVPVDSNKYAFGATVTVLGNSGSLVNAGYTFSGWNTLANGSGTAYAAGATFAMGSGNLTLYAQWTQVPTYTVSYNGNGATGGVVPVDSNKYASGATVTVLGNSGSLVNAGFTFSGWNTLANGSGTAYAAGATFAMGSGNLTLYAQWTQVPTYTVAYNANGATGGAVPVDSNKYALGATVTVLGNSGSLVNAGYTFSGWNTLANGSGTAYAAGATFAMGSGNLTLYAQWTQVPTYTVSYNPNGATGGAVPVDSNKYASGATVTVLGNTGSLVNAGYTFSGWNTLVNGSGTAYAVGATFAMGSGNLTLYAQWTQVPTYTVAYNANGATGGAVPVDSNKYASGATVTVLGNSGSLVNAGYTFSGWNTLANGSGTAYAAGATFAMGSSNLTLYAQWTASGATFTVTYAGNGNTSGFGLPDPNQYTAGATVTVHGNLGYFFKPGYSFDGWNTAPDGSGANRAIGQTFTMGTGNVTLYAQWNATNWPPASIWGGAREVITLKPDGTVWCWGLNAHGQVGNGTTTDASLPVQVVGPGGTGYLTDIVAVMGGEQHNIALKSDGTVWTWGDNKEDQLGDGNAIDSSSPVQVSGLTSVVKLAGRGYHSVAVKSDGTVWSWGWDEYGALGIGVADANFDYPVPVQVQGVTNPIMVTTGFNFGVALMQDHTLMAWGNNEEGEIGDGTTTDRLTPVPVPGIDQVVWVSAGWTHVVAIRADGTVWTWGANNWQGAFDCEDAYDNNNLGYFCGYGMLGDGTTTDHYTPEQVPGLSGAIMALGGDSSTSVLLRDGTVWTFGSNGAGQLGVPGIDQSLVPMQVQGLCSAVYIMTRDFHNEALCTDGSLWSWGSGTSGELGNGALNNSAVPVQVTSY